MCNCYAANATPITTQLVYIIGTSLSEPHTSVTALAEVVCMFAAIYHKF